MYLRGETQLMATPNSVEPPMENLCLVWIDPSATNDEQLIDQFYNLVDDLNLFQDISTGLKYLRMVYRERVLVIIAAPVEREVINEIHGMSYVHAIYLVQDLTSQSLSSKSIWSRAETVTGQLFLPCPALKSCPAEPVCPGSPVRSCTGKNLCTTCPVRQDRTGCPAGRTGLMLPASFRFDIMSFLHFQKYFLSYRSMLSNEEIFTDR